MRCRNLSFLSLQDIRVGPLQNAGPSPLESRSVLTQSRTTPSGLDTDHRNLFILQEGMKQTNGIAASSNAGQQSVGESVFLAEDLFFSFSANHRLKVSHHHWVGMGAKYRPEQVVGVAHISNPVANSFIDCVLKGFAAARHTMHLST